MVSANVFYHTPIFSFVILLLIYGLLAIFGALVYVLISGIWGEAREGAAAARMTKFKAWLKRITFYEILIGIKTTLKHLLHDQPITFEYPYEKRDWPDNYRGMLALLRYDDGTEKCVGCDLCEAACPSRVISAISAEAPGEPTKRYAREYYMDMTRCLFCGMCVEACPVDALGMTREYEWSVYDKRKLWLNKQQLLAIGDRSFPIRGKRLEFQHPNVAVFNIALHNHPLRTSQRETEARRRDSQATRVREEAGHATDVTRIGEHRFTTAEAMDSAMLELDPCWAEHLVQTIDRQFRERVESIRGRC